MGERCEDMALKEFFDSAREYTSGLIRENAIGQAVKDAESNLQLRRPYLFRPTGEDISRDYTFVTQQCAFSENDEHYMPFNSSCRLARGLGKVYPPSGQK